ncbi:hypothetical protein [Streptomyces sp. NPDC047000]|uniref:hypothetical protein n=1 Tax=Streptomyces sp. NPDC047000 TaxID=3155474 RepID=UPI0033F66787
MKLTFGNDWRATVTDEPLRIKPRFLGTTVDIAQYASAAQRVRFLADTFGSEDWLWDFPDVLRFAPYSRKLVGVQLRIPFESHSVEDATHVRSLPEARPGGLRADEARDFRHEMCTVAYRAPGDTAFTCLRDLAVLDEPLQARIGIAPDLALLVQQGTVVGWSLTDPIRYVTSAFADPDPTPPSPAVRRLFTDCLDLISLPLFYDVADGEPPALARLRATDEALRAQHEDHHRAAALREWIATMVEYYGMVEDDGS